MNADDLRAVAAEIRYKAAAFVAPDPTPTRMEIDRYGTCDQCGEGRHLVASYPDGDSEPWLCAPCAAYTDHVAAWERQPVALAVADWLDSVGSDTYRGSVMQGLAFAFIKAWRAES